MRYGIGIDDIMCDDITCDDLHLASVAGMVDMSSDDLHLAGVAGMDDITCEDLRYGDLNPECEIMGLGLMI